MTPNPLTTPPAEASPSNLGILPQDGMNMGSDTMDERHNLEERPESQEQEKGEDALSLSDTDMSDGGVPLPASPVINTLPQTPPPPPPLETSPPIPPPMYSYNPPGGSIPTMADSAQSSSHAQLLNAELDEIDVELMGSENLEMLVQEGHYPAMENHFFLISPQNSFPPPGPHPYTGFPQVFGIDENDVGINGPVELAQQLQHLQDQATQDHMDFQGSEVFQDIQDHMEDQTNLNLAEFLFTWGRTQAGSGRGGGPYLPEVVAQRNAADNGPLRPIEVRDLQGEKCDIQGLNWHALKVSRADARRMRRETYRNYTSVRPYPGPHHYIIGARIPAQSDVDFMKFRRMDFDREVKMAHFQLRNLIACSSRDHVFYASRSKVMQFTPRIGETRPDASSVALDLTDPIIPSPHAFAGGIPITTLTVGHNILVAGGFHGEYGLVNLRAHKNTRHTEGLISQHNNSITNHIEVHLSRGSSLPLAAFATNDHGLRLLDVNTNKIVAEHKYDYAINCSSLSPDQRLRVLVGDTQKALICNAETGEILQELDGHHDYGFACDWADDGRTVATGNQDMQIKIWDARKWKNSSGHSTPLASLRSEMAGTRKLKFSPLGSGKRVLVAAEPADIINIIDAETFSSKQTLSFFGEIGGFDFANNGQDLFVATCDSMRGGIIQFERCGDGRNANYGHEDGTFRSARCKGSDWGDDENMRRHPKSQGTEMNRSRKSARLGTNMDPF